MMDTDVSRYNCFPESLDPERPNMANCRGMGIRRGKHEGIRAESYPTKQRPNEKLSLSFDMNELFIKYT